MRGAGHSWEAGNFLTLGASVRGSKAYSESGGTSRGRPTSTNSPGQTVIDVGGGGGGGGGEALLHDVRRSLLLLDAETRN